MPGVEDDNAESGLKRRAVLGGLAALLGVIAAAWLALWYFIPTPPSTVTMAVGFRGGSLDRFARDYQQSLARRQVTLTLRYIEDTAIDRLKLLEDPKSGIDASFVLSGVADANRSPGVRSLGRVLFNPVWIFYRGTETFDRLPQFEGKRLGANLNMRLVRDLLALNGLNSENTTLQQRVGPAAVRALREGDVDVLVLGDPLESPLVQSLLKDPDTRLMNVAQAEALTRALPYLERLVLPSGVIDLKKNIPASDINLVATGTSVVVRENLHPQLIYLLAQTLQEEHGKAGIFQKAGEFPTQTDPEFAVAEEARDLYKNGPSLLQKYLPYWQITLAKRAAAIVLAVIAVAIPVLAAIPRLYQWFQQIDLRRLYRRLRALEAELALDLSAPEIELLQTSLEAIDREVRSLPKRHAALFFDLLMHIDLMRARLATRLAAVRLPSGCKTTTSPGPIDFGDRPGVTGPSTPETSSPIALDQG
jgi:uncharacterized protein